MQTGNKPVVSVIMPAYNAMSNIERALKSVISQTYENLEVIVIDDGSSDDTGKIVDRYAKADLRIKVVHTENGGEAKARNIGVSMATGEYIGFCDADDYMHTDMIEKMLTRMLKDESEIVVCSWKNVDEYGKKLPWKETNLQSCVLSSEQAQIQFLTSGNVEGFCWNKIFKKKLFNDNDIRYDEKRISYCDILANFKLLCAAETISYIQEPLYDYYQLSTACTHVANIKKDADYYETLMEICSEEKTTLKDNKCSIYVVNRMSKHLFNMYKEIDTYKMDEYIKYYIKAYDEYLQVSSLTKILYAIRYPLESPIKFIAKTLIVSINYKKYKTGKMRQVGANNA